MGKYKVVLACYVPVGTGLRYKHPGQVVMLSEDEAAVLTGYVEPADQEAEDRGVAERNTEEVAESAEPVEQEPEDQGVAKRNTRRHGANNEEAAQEEAAEGVTYVGDSESGHE